MEHLDIRDPHCARRGQSRPGPTRRLSNPDQQSQRRSPNADGALEAPAVAEQARAKSEQDPQQRRRISRSRVQTRFLPRQSRPGLNLGSRRQLCTWGSRCGGLNQTRSRGQIRPGSAAAASEHLSINGADETPTAAESAWAKSDHGPHMLKSTWTRSGVGASIYQQRRQATPPVSNFAESARAKSDSGVQRRHLSQTRVRASVDRLRRLDPHCCRVCQG